MLYYWPYDRFIEEKWKKRYIVKVLSKYIYQTFMSNLISKKNVQRFKKKRRPSVRYWQHLWEIIHGKKPGHFFGLSFPKMTFYVCICSKSSRLFVYIYALLFFLFCFVFVLFFLPRSGSPLAAQTQHGQFSLFSLWFLFSVTFSFSPFSHVFPFLSHFSFPLPSPFYNFPFFHFHSFLFWFRLPSFFRFIKLLYSFSSHFSLITSLLFDSFSSTFS